MVFRDPFVVGKIVEFDTEKAYIDYILKLFTDNITELYSFEQRKKTLVEIIDKLADQPDKLSGAVKLVGDNFKAIVTRRQNVTYGKITENGVDMSPLQLAYEKIPDFREAIAIKFEERTSTMTKLLLEGVGERFDKETTRKLVENRKVNQGTPQVEVKLND